MRRAGHRVRIAAKLTDAADGMQMWAERFEDTLEDVFGLQDTVADAVVGQIEPTIRAAEIRRANARPTENLDAYDLYLRAVHAFSRIDRSSLERAAALLDSAVVKDPDYALALAVASTVRAQLVAQQVSASPEDDRARALELRAGALRAGGDDPEVLLWLAVSGVNLGLSAHTAEAHAEAALAALPGCAMAWLAAGSVACIGGRWPLAQSRLETALRLDPRSAWRFWILEGLGIAQFGQGRFEEAIPLLLEVADLRPAYAPWMISLAASAFGHLGRNDDALRLLKGHQEPGGYFFGLFPPEFDDLRRAGLAQAAADA